MKKRKTLYKKQEEKPLKIVSNGPLAGIPIEFILITIIMVSFFILIILFLGPCTESGLIYNNNTLMLLL